MFALPYKPMSSKRKQVVQSLMIAAAKVIDDYRGEHSRNAFRAELMKQLDDCNPVIFGMALPSEAVEAMRACKAVEWEIVQGYSRLVMSICKKWINGHFTCYVDADDMIQEGLCALIDAIYAFKGSHKGQSIKFKTYAHTAINRRVSRMVNDTLTGHLRRPLHVQSLLTKYDAVKLSLGQASPMEVMDGMEATLPQRVKLERASMRVVTEEVFMTGERVAAVNLVPAKEEFVPEPDEKAALDHVMGQLSDFERAVLEGCMEGEYGWQADVASRFINPRTQKPYSRRAPHVVLEKVRTLMAG